MWKCLCCVVIILESALGALVSFFCILKQLLKTVVSEIWTPQVSTVINLWLLFSQKCYTADKITDIWVFSLHSCCGKSIYNSQTPKISFGRIYKYHIHMTFNKHCSLNYKNETKSPDNVKCSSFIPLKYHNFNTNRKNIDHIFTSWHEFRNSITTEIGLLHL